MSKKWFYLLSSMMLVMACSLFNFGGGGDSAVVSDSGTITEESSILDFPAVTIRQAHERPEGMDEGTVIMCGLKADRVLESIAVANRHQNDKQRQFRMVPDYEPNNVSKKVLRIILSYTDYVNRTVWSRF